MKLFQGIQIGDEIEFIDSNDKIETALVTFVNNKKFSVEVQRYNKFKNYWYSRVLDWTLNGKKLNRYHNHGIATRVVNRWSKIETKKTEL